MKVLVVGSGGREHALALKLAQSPKVQVVYVAPGNGGTALDKRLQNVPVTDPAALADFARQESVHFTVVGPEAPLAAGIVDVFRAQGLRIFGPSKAAAQLESSKDFAKAFMHRHQIPTAAYQTFADAAEAHAYIDAQGAPIVIKADGLAAGKGVTVAMSVEEAEEAIIDCFSGAFGESGAAVVIEEFMEGEEVSLFVLCDGETLLPLTTAQDHKRAFDGDTGPNTGGMGAYSPAPVMTREQYEFAMQHIVEPTARGLAKRGTPYQGVLYAGLMLTEDGPKLVEYNARFGDPETQVMMMRMESDLLPLLYATATGTLSGHTVTWKDAYALTVIMATRGYPGAYGKGSEIRGLDGLDSGDLTVFHAGTKREGSRLLANGGRVLNVTALGNSVKEAQGRAYRGVDAVDWPEGFSRRDIGWREIAREKD